jgi:lipopolysaccharide/colanic/teichoic acid biosynthesis glycosyltransferase
VRDQEVDEVVVALPASAHAEILRLNSELADTDVSVRILPDVFEMVAMRARVEDFYGLPLISLREASMNPVQARVKRAFDIVLASLVILVTLPAMLVIAVWVRLDSPGPALVHQRRVGAGATSSGCTSFGP